MGGRAHQHRILVVDDERKLVEAVAAYLEAAGYAVTAAATGRDALAALERAEHSLVILDLMLPDMPGERICAAIRARSRVPVLMLTAKVEEGAVLQGFRVGADDYMTKPFSPRELVARVEALLRRTEGEGPLSRLIELGDGDLVIDTAGRTVSRAGQALALTPREYELLLAFASNPGRTFTREELISRAFGDEYGAYDRTVDSHIKNLRAKIEPEPRRPRYIATVHGVGYRLGP